MSLPGTGRAIAALAAGCGASRGHGACCGKGTAPRERRCGRPNDSGNATSRPSYQSDAGGAGSVAALAYVKLGIFGQCEIATFSETGCNCHCCGSVGVFGSSG